MPSLSTDAAPHWASSLVGLPEFRLGEPLCSAQTAQLYKADLPGPCVQGCALVCVCVMHVCTSLDSLWVAFIRFSKGIVTSYNDNDLWNTGDQQLLESPKFNRASPAHGARPVWGLGDRVPRSWDFLPHLSKEQRTIVLDNPQSNTARPQVLRLPSFWRPETKAWRAV